MVCCLCTILISSIFSAFPDAHYPPPKPRLNPVLCVPGLNYALMQTASIVYLCLFRPCPHQSMWM